VSTWLPWVAGVGVPLLIAAFTIWWKIEARQDRKIDKMAETHRNNHRVIHDKIDRLHDKIVDLWKNRGRTDGK